MDLIKDWLNDQFGRILFVGALIWSGVAIYLNGAQALPESLTNLRSEPIHVPLDQKALAAASLERFFTAGKATDYLVEGRFVFVPEKVITEFKPVDLDIPPLTVIRPPQILPDPGPSLDGAHKLPRFGDELPPVVVQDTSKKK